MGLWQGENPFGDFVKGMLDVLATPSNYLASHQLPFIERYVCGGVFLAHAHWILLRCRSAKIDPSKKDDWIAEQVIDTCIVPFIRDDSFGFPQNRDVVINQNEDLGSCRPQFSEGH